MPILEIWVSDETLSRLKHAAKKRQNDEDEVVLAEYAVEGAALDYAKHTGLLNQ